MTELPKINFDIGNYNYELLYRDNDSNSINITETPIFELPQSKNYLTIYILINDFQEENLAQLANCITSIKVQSFANINIELLNLDKNHYTQSITKKVATNTNCGYILAETQNIGTELEKAIKENKSEYICIIDYKNIFPRIKEIEYVVNLLFKQKYDYLTLTIHYTNADNTPYNLPETNNRLLNATDNYHYSAFFNRTKLKEIKLSEINERPIDSNIVKNFKINNLNGNHLISKTEIKILGQLER